MLREQLGFDQNLSTDKLQEEVRQRLLNEHDISTDDLVKRATGTEFDGEFEINDTRLTEV
jgi:hypothetical protein